MKSNFKLVSGIFIFGICFYTTACNLDSLKNQKYEDDVRTEEEIVEDLNTRFSEYKPFEAVSSELKCISDPISNGQQIEVHLKSEKLPEKDIIVKDKHWICHGLFGTTNPRTYTSNLYYLLYSNNLIKFYENYYAEILKDRDYKIICHYATFRTIESDKGCSNYLQFCSQGLETDRCYIVISGENNEELDNQLRNADIRKKYPVENIENISYLFIGDDNLNDVNDYSDIGKYNVLN